MRKSLIQADLVHQEELEVLKLRLKVLKLRVRDDQDLMQVDLAQQEDQVLKMRLKVLKKRN